MNAEQVLLDDIRRGDRAAMRRLYDRYSGYATAVGLRYIPIGKICAMFYRTVL
ncbi:hypothetical protein [Hoylesella enoeca]|uniref:hypothetical protein n=1 Tax=Hoylesella enoeca TaxID=76123 RepID=UPI000AE0D15A|nr:hypothetical protein [Hoylesella enoeca]